MSNKILIIEDDPLMGKALAVMTKRMKLGPLHVQSGKEAMAAIRENDATNIAVAVIDLNIADENGADLLSTIRQAYPHIKAILCTGMVDDPIANVSFDDFGFDHVLKKPFNEEDFRKTVNTTLGEESGYELALA